MKFEWDKAKAATNLGKHGVLFDEGASLARKGDFVNKAEDDMRAEYKRADFTSLERGKFDRKAVKGTTVALLDPAIAKVFPTSEAVNEALLGLLTLAQQAALIAAPEERPARKRPSTLHRR